MSGLVRAEISPKPETDAPPPACTVCVCVCELVGVPDEVTEDDEPDEPRRAPEAMAPRVACWMAEG